MAVWSAEPTLMSIEVRRVRADDAALLRDTRLRALADAPTAFGTTLAEAQAYPDTEWTERARRGAASGEHAMFVAVDGGRGVGMAGGWLGPDDPALADLTSMWVDPAYRGQGVGRRLVTAVLDWARGRGARRLQLWVTAGNDAARNLYLHCGFAATGDHQPLPSHPQLAEERLERAL